MPPAGLTPVAWAASFSPAPGTLLAAVGPGEIPPAVGALSVPRRDRKGPDRPKDHLPLRVPAAAPEMDGPAAPGGGFEVERVSGDSALAAGIRPGDHIRTVAGTPVARAEDLAGCMKGRLSGDLVTVELDRARKRVELQLSLRAFAAQGITGDSYRADDFPVVFEADLPIFTYECGGPVVDLTGGVVGIAIARVSIPGALVLPGDIVRELLPALKSGKLAGNWVPQGS